MKEVIMIKIIFPSSFLMKTLLFYVFIKCFCFVSCFISERDPGCEARPAQLKCVSSFDIFFDTIKSIVIQSHNIYESNGGKCIESIKKKHRKVSPQDSIKL